MWARLGDWWVEQGLLEQQWSGWWSWHLVDEVVNGISRVVGMDVLTLLRVCVVGRVGSRVWWSMCYLLQCETREEDCKCDKLPAQRERFLLRRRTSNAITIPNKIWETLYFIHMHNISSSSSSSISYNLHHAHATYRFPS